MDLTAERERDPRIEALYNAGVNCYSFSKLGVINTCLYEAWRTYVLHDRGLDSIYTGLGNKIHNILEAIMHGEKSKDDLLPALNEELSELDSIGLAFPKDFRGEDSIRKKWIADMTHFCNSFSVPNGNFDTEVLVILRVSPTRAIIGYADLVRHNADGTVSIFDWKTSSDYRKEDLLEHGRQLTIYAMALEQAGYQVKQTAWIMLKYVTVKYFWYPTKRSKEKSRIVRHVNRSKLYSTIHDAVEAECVAANMDTTDIEFAMMKFKETNVLGDEFPETVRSKFSIKPYVKNYTYDEDLKQEALDYINRTADIFEALPKDKDKPWAPRDITKTEEFFCHTLCAHRKTCPAIKDYDARTIVKSNTNNDDDLF